MSFINIDNSRGLSYLSFGDIFHHSPIILLHGIMGNKKNLRGLASALLHKNAFNSVLIFDIRNHGDSTKHWEPFTVYASALDIVEAVLRLKIHPKAIMGHSFGGKVAVLSALYLKTLQSVWLLDCSPGLMAQDNLLPLQILNLLEQVSWPLTERLALVEYLQSHKVSDLIAYWLTTNLWQDHRGVWLNFEAKEIRQMLLDFTHLDLWPEVYALGRRMKVHLVKAEREKIITKEDEEKMTTKNLQGHRFFHLLQRSGHFMHVDNLKGLMDIFTGHL